MKNSQKIKFVAAVVLLSVFFTGCGNLGGEGEDLNPVKINYPELKQALMGGTSSRILSSEYNVGYVDLIRTDEVPNLEQLNHEEFEKLVIEKNIPVNTQTGEVTVNINENFKYAIRAQFFNSETNPNFDPENSIPAGPYFLMLSENFGYADLKANPLVKTKEQKRTFFLNETASMTVSDFEIEFQQSRIEIMFTNDMYYIGTEPEQDIIGCFAGTVTVDLGFTVDYIFETQSCTYLETVMDGTSRYADLFLSLNNSEYGTLKIIIPVHLGPI